MTAAANVHSIRRRRRRRYRRIGTHQYGFPDYSVYKLNALRIVEGANGVPVVQEVATGLLSDHAQMVPDDP